MAVKLENLSMEQAIELREEVKQVAKQLRRWGIKEPAFEEFKRAVARRVQGLKLKESRRGQQLERELAWLQSRVEEIQGELSQTQAAPKARRARRKK